MDTKIKRKSLSALSVRQWRLHPRFQNINWAILLASFSLLLAIIATTVSVREYSAGKRLFWTGFIEGNTTLHISPANRDAAVEIVALTFPSAIISSPPMRLQGSQYRFDLTELKKALSEGLSKRVHRDGNLFRTYPPVGFSVPVLIETRFIVKGAPRIERSLYLIFYDPKYTLQEVDDGDVSDAMLPVDLVPSIIFSHMEVADTFDPDPDGYFEKSEGVRLGIEV